MNTTKRRIIAIVGPTASGKTSVGVRLAKELSAGFGGGEIVSADSRQIFRGLDLGTGKDLAAYGGVKYHLIDIKSPEEEFNLFEYTKLAKLAIEDIFSRGKVPIIVGGTGLYVQALVEGFKLTRGVIPDLVGDPLIVDSRTPKGTHTGIPDIPDLRGNDNVVRYEKADLEKMSVEQLQDSLQEIDSEAYEKLSDKKNPHRLIRAIERSQEGISMTKEKPDFEVLQIGIGLPQEVLNKRIDKRADDRFEQGMLEEVIGLLKSGVDPKWLLKLGLEYRIMTGYILKIEKLSKHSIADLNDKTIKQYNNEFESMKDELKLRSHQYAKRQVTWFKRFPEVVWESNYDKMYSLAVKFIKG